MSDLIASLDGGGTKTQIAWADASGHGGGHRIDAGCNPQDRSDWLDPIRAALATLPRPPAHIIFGIPGYGEIPALDADITRSLTALCPACTVLNDVALAYQGAFPDGGGVLILSGTGSMAMAQGPLGLQRTGGWGDAFGDEGSAYAIGRTALSRASQMIDGRLPDTGFADRLMQRLGCKPEDGPFALMTWVNAQTHPRAAIASVAAHVDALAERGETDAMDLLDAAAADLHQLSTTATRLAGLKDAAPWVAAGSVFRSIRLTAALSSRIGQSPQPAAHSALSGGLIRAARALGWPADAAWCAAISQKDTA